MRERERLEKISILAQAIRLHYSLPFLQIIIYLCTWSDADLEQSRIQIEKNVSRALEIIRLRDDVQTSCVSSQ